MLEDKVKLSQERIYTHTQGTGKDVVLLHGWGMHSGIWNSILPELVSRYRVTLIDLPGHGRSTPAGFTLDSLVNNLNEIMPAHSILVGWSLGAIVGQRFAITFPEKLDKLILVSGTPRFVDAEDWPHATGQEVFSQFSRDLAQDYPSTLKRFIYLQSRGGEKAGETQKQLHEAMVNGRQPDSVSLRCGLDILGSTDLREELNKIQCPVQLVMGERDTLVPVGVGSDIIELLDKARLEIITGAGHAPFLSHPAKFIQVVNYFIEAGRSE